MSQVRHDRISRTVHAAVLGAALMAFPAIAAAQGPPYTYQTLRYPGSTNTEVYGLTNSGMAVGTYTDAAGVTHGFKYEAGTYSIVDFPGATHSNVLGVNNLGHIVGGHSFNGSDGPWHSFVYKDGVFTQFDFPGWESDARGINAAGDIAGVYNESGILPTQGFIRKVGEAGETFTTLNYPGALYTLLWALNDSGNIAGSYINNNDPAYTYHGFLYSNSKFTNIDYPGALATKVFGMNNLNDVVGAHSQINGAHAFVYSNGRFRSFDVPNSTASGATAINDSRQVAGIYYSADCPSGCGFIATPLVAVPRCQQNFQANYTLGSLSLNFTGLNSAVATRWETWVNVAGLWYRLWSTVLPAGTNAGPFTVPITLAPSGRVIGLSTMSITGTGAICADYSIVETSPPSQP